MSSLEELKKISKELNKKMGIQEIKNNVNNQQTYMMVKEHGQPYDNNYYKSFMIVREHGQPYDKIQPIGMTTRMVGKEHGQPYNKNKINPINTNTDMIIPEHGQPYNKK
jgi:hypothetical protein